MKQTNDMHVVNIIDVLDDEIPSVPFMRRFVVEIPKFMIINFNSDDMKEYDKMVMPSGMRLYGYEIKNLDHYLKNAIT